MEQEIDHKKQLSSIIDDPDRLRHSDIPLLKELVEQYPYFQPLRLILAKLSMETEAAEQTLTTSALYTNGAMLHKFLHRKAVLQAEIASSPEAPTFEDNALFEDRAVFEDKSIFEEATDLEAASLLEEVYTFGESDPEQPEEIDGVEEVNDTPLDDQQTYEEIAEINIHDYEKRTDHALAETPAEDEDSTYDEIAEINIHDYESHLDHAAAETPAEDEDSTYDEIVEINIHDYEGDIDHAAAETSPETSMQNEYSTYDEISEINIHDYETPAGESAVSGNAPVIETLEDNFVENIAATDFFAFEENFIADDKSEGKAQREADASQTLAVPAAPAWATQPHATQPLARQTEKDTSELSNYDDDTLPYTFLWWLAKTRKEHSTTFQPYATPKKQRPNELHQQYVEHIFHIQSPFNAEEILNNVPEHQADPKDAKIIDEFLKKDPQITPPRPEQIDNENKAKRSAEDHNDLVSETLAKIYIEQMLYHKAIDTYEKLSLKFPEKSRYFADLIQSIKKKI